VRAAVPGDQLALLPERAEQRLQPVPRRGVRGLDPGEDRADPAQVRLDHRLEQVVLGLEVVVHVAERDARGRRDVRQGGLLRALLVDPLARGGDQPVPLARRPGLGVRARTSDRAKI
jgi:hypothetical protein